MDTFWVANILLDTELGDVDVEGEAENNIFIIWFERSKQWTSIKINLAQITKKFSSLEKQKTTIKSEGVKCVDPISLSLTRFRFHFPWRIFHTFSRLFTFVQKKFGKKQIEWPQMFVDRDLCGFDANFDNQSCWFIFKLLPARSAEPVVAWLVGIFSRLLTHDLDKLWYQIKLKYNFLCEVDFFRRKVCIDLQKFSLLYGFIKIAEINILDFQRFWNRSRVFSSFIGTFFSVYTECFASRKYQLLVFHVLLKHNF